MFQGVCHINDIMVWERTISLSLVTTILLVGALLRNWVDKSRNISRWYYCNELVHANYSRFWLQAVLRVTITYCINHFYVHCFTAFVRYEYLFARESFCNLLILARTFNIEIATVFPFSFCVGLATWLNDSALGILKHRYITKVIRDPWNFDW